MAEVNLGELPVVLDGMSELMVFSNYPEARNVMLFGFELEGPVDIGAMNLALKLSLSGFPQFVSSVKESRVSGKSRLVWRPDPDFSPELRLSDLENSDSSVPFQHSLLRHLNQSLEKDWDLLHTVPSEFHLIRLPNKGHCLLTLVHHAAADGWTLTAFYKQLLTRYHEITTGREPGWAPDSDFASSVKKGMVKLKTRRWRDALFFVRNALSLYFTRPTLPRGNGIPRESGVHYAKWVLTPEETDRVVANVARFKSPFIDALVGGVASAVDRWNGAQNIAPGNTVICVTVQMRGRFGEAEAATNSSSILLKLRPEERKTPEVFARAVADRRREQMDSLADVRAWQVGSSLSSAVRVLPLAARQRIVHSVCQLPLVPILIAPFGLMWPEIKDGRRTGDSYLKQSGELSLNEFHAMPYKLGYRCPLILGAHTFRKRLNLQVMASAGLFTAAEAEGFVRLIGEVLVQDPFGGASGRS